MSEIGILSPCGRLGHGFPEASLTETARIVGQKPLLGGLVPLEAPPGRTS